MPQGALGVIVVTALPNWFRHNPGTETSGDLQ